MPIGLWRVDRIYFRRPTVRAIASAFAVAGVVMAATKQTDANELVEVIRIETTLSSSLKAVNSALNCEMTRVTSSRGPELKALLDFLDESNSVRPLCDHYAAFHRV